MAKAPGRSNGFEAALVVATTLAVRTERIPVRLTEDELRALGRAARENQTTPEAFLRALWKRWCLDDSRSRSDGYLRSAQKEVRRGD
jgi:hypothetical protein